ENLKKIINFLLNKPENDHVHLMSAECGGSELSSEKQCNENIEINHIKIFKWEVEPPDKNVRDLTHLELTP
ncbi:MAG: Imm32 family immunity protein, partial [Gammaproteobacteria bacterium]